jgi:hypothetical protein
LIFIFVLGMSIGFAQDKIPAFPSTQRNISPEEFDLQSSVKRKVKLIKREFFGLIYQCQAARENNPAYCQNDKSGAAICNRSAKFILDLRSLAEGRCSELSTFPADVCAAIAEGNCANLPSQDATRICQAFLKRDPSLLYGKLKKPYNVEGFEDLGEDYAVNFYYGFKFYSAAACDRFKSWRQGGCYLPKLACKVLFSPESTQKIIDDTALDLAYLSYVKGIKRDIGVCDRIEDPEIRDACRDSRIKTLASFFTN